MNGLVVINWPLVIICGLILISLIWFTVYFLRLIIKALKLYIKEHETKIKDGGKL